MSEAINIDGIKNQTEGGVIQAASWTLIEEVKYDNHITSKDWASYPIYRFEEVLSVEVEVNNAWMKKLWEQEKLHKAQRQRL